MEINVVEKTKNFSFRSFFLYDGAENRPPNLVSWVLAEKYFETILAIFQKKNSWMQVKSEILERSLK